MKHTKVGLAFIVGLLVGFSLSLFLKNAAAIESKEKCSINHKASDGCVPIKEFLRTDCDLPKSVKCFYVPIKIVDDQGHEVDEEWGSSVCKHEKTVEMIKLDGIKSKDDSVVENWISFLKAHPEIESVRIDILGKNASIADTNKRIELIIEKITESGITSDRVIKGKYIKSKDSLVRISIIKIKEQ